MSVVNVRVSEIRPPYKNLKEWMANPNHVYIGRGHVVFIDGERFPPQSSVWANPFTVGDHGRETALSLYEQMIRQKLAHEGTAELLALRGKVLGCWCVPQPCHGHILLKLIEEMSAAAAVTNLT